MKNLILFFAFTAFLALTIPINGTGSRAFAVSPSEWKAGRIIDDNVFTNSKDMTVAQIQSFLNNKVGTNGYDSVPGKCDNQGERNAAPYNSSITRKKYAENAGYIDHTFTCLNQYYEVPKTSPSPDMPYNNYGNQPGDPNPSGSKSAAQIIYDAAQESSISPRVLLVMLQKESAGPLVTDDWPFEKQYRYAMGAYCPDGAYGAECDENYAGFSIQMYEAARLFRWYINNMDKDWWPYKKPNQTNHILWQVKVMNGKNTNCGGSDVHIHTYATAALYTYTPYQPNKASLESYPGSGDYCSSYGNRNFWFMFNNWFGPTTRAKISSVKIDGNSDKTGERAQVGFRLSQKPANNVTIEFAISSPSNARIVDSSSVTITPNTWNNVRANTITIRGLDNSNLTGTFQYSLVPTKVTSKDSSFSSVGPSQIGNIPLIQQDNSNGPNVYRLYNDETKQHMLTASKIHRDQKLSDGWRDEGVRFSYCYTGNQTVARLNLGESRRLTIDGSSAYNNAIKSGFNEENIDFAVSSQGTVPVYWLYNTTTGNSLYTTNKTEATGGAWEDRGIAFRTCEPDLLSVYRLYRPATRSHLFTISVSERDRAINELDFRYEGLGFYSCAGGDVNFYRLFRKSNGNHIYTTSKSEHDTAVNEHNFNSEGVKFRLCSTHERDVYRLYNSSLKNHFYTISPTERDKVVKDLGYRDEGAKFQVK